MTTVTKEFTFDCAHMLDGHRGLCKNLHGHTYKLLVTVGDRTSSGDMVVDFSDLKQIVKEHIVDVYDHAVILNEDSDDLFEQELCSLVQAYDKKHVMFGQRATAERMAQEFASTLRKPLAHIGVELVAVRLYETPTSYAEVR